MSTGNQYRNRSSNRDALLEEELAELEKVEGTVQDKELEKPKTPAEETWAKRYADGRRYQQTLADKITALEAALKNKPDEPKFPKSTDEVSEWRKVYPDLWGIMKTMVLEEVEGSKEVVEKRFKELDEKERVSARRDAYKKLLELHSDFEDIKDTQEFEDWVADQPTWVHDALYINETDAKAAARAIDLYKLDSGMFAKAGKKKEATDTRSAAQSVKTPSGSAPKTDIHKWSESKVANLNKRDTDKYWPEIEAAISDGTFVYDISAGAR